MPDAKRRLKSMTTGEVSFVDKAAVKRKFLVMKADDEESDDDDDDGDVSDVANLFTKLFKVNMTLPQILEFTRWMEKDESAEFFASIEKCAITKDLLNGFSELEPKVLKKSLGPLLKPDTGSGLLSVLKAEMPTDFMDQRTEDFENGLDELGSNALSLTRTMVNMLNDFFNRGVKPGDSTFIAEEPTMVEKSLTKDEISALPQNVQDHIQAMADDIVTVTSEKDNVQKSLNTKTTKLAAVEKELSKVKKSEQSDDPMDGMTEVQKSFFNGQTAKIALLQKAADKAETQVFIQKAADLKLPEIKADDFGLVLKEVSEKCSEGTYASVEKALTSAAETISKADLLDEIGANGEPVFSDKEQKLAAAAAEIQKADKCTMEVAVTKALVANPDLY